MLRYATAREGVSNDSLAHAVLAGEIATTACGRDVALLVPAFGIEWGSASDPRCQTCARIVG